MAKAAAVEKQVPAVQTEEIDLFAGFSEEDKARMLGLTGQSAQGGGMKTPILKVNQISSDTQDSVPEERRVKMGNFVLDQRTKGKDIEDIGEDFGAAPEITVLKYGTKFSFFPDLKKNPNGKKDICQSNIVFDRGEQYFGDNLGFNCMSKTDQCPRRKDGVAKDDKCKCQNVVFAEIGPEHKNCLIYLKGESFMPFTKYVEEANKSGLPLFFFPTKLTTEKKVEGSNTYWVITPELQTDKPYSPEEKMRLFKKAEEIDQQARAFEQQRQGQITSRKAESQKALPPGMSVEKPSAGQGKAAGIAGADVSDAEYDDIAF